ncbi:hypothetical protein ACFRFJ_21240 [Streptomyces hydrogenans]|uniref:hypothetical protein n=1 Tax=Streptomyces hydrogenans TaxID=1873719 RepID=UPI00367D4B54
MRPLHDRNTTACALTYADVLHWPLAIGHRFRRRAGCTCPKTTACPTPGAHPLPGPVTPLNAGSIADAFDQTPGAGIIAPCDHFDAVTLPGPVGTALLLMLDRFTVHAPSLADLHGTVTVLVEPGTSHRLAETCTDLVIHTGPTAWIALPPSHGIRWDTPPVPHRPLPHALTLRPHLERVVTLARRAGERP